MLCVRNSKNLPKAPTVKWIYTSAQLLRCCPGLRTGRLYNTCDYVIYSFIKYYIHNTCYVPLPLRELVRSWDDASACKFEEAEDWPMTESATDAEWFMRYASSCSESENIYPMVSKTENIASIQLAMFKSLGTYTWLQNAIISIMKTPKTFRCTTMNFSKNKIHGTDAQKVCSQNDYWCCTKQQYQRPSHCHHCRLSTVN